MKKMVEICCGSYSDMLKAIEGGADRIELNSALALGGLTPSLTALELIRKQSPIKIITMIRPRPAGFIYNEEEFAEMLGDAEKMLRHGADGIAFGCLANNLMIDRVKTEALVTLVHSFGREAVFHRAFDAVAEPQKAIETLIDLKVDRILTSAQRKSATQGRERLKELQARYGARIEILMCGSVTAENVRELMEYTKIPQVHSSAKCFIDDLSTKTKYVSNACCHDEHELAYQAVSLANVTALVEASKKAIL